FSTPLGSTGLRVVTPPERLTEALTVIRELAAGLGRDDDSRCATLRAEPPTSVALPVFAMVAKAGAGVTQAPQWVTAGWSETRFRSAAAPVMAVGAAVEVVGRHGTLEIVGLTGERTLVDLISGRRTSRPPLFPIAYGLGCAVRIDGEWWIVEPRTGRVFSKHPGAASLPAGPWIGIAGGPNGEVVLASANQAIVIFDPMARREIARFEARVSPSVRSMADECSPIAAGIDWISTVNLGTTVASFYDRAGHALGTVRLDRRVNLPGTPLTAFAGAGHYLGFAMNTLVVQTFAVTVDPSCVGVARAGAVAE
ncbi:MAG: hypothetical protein ACREQL_12345, partial [Candidatus Binatia bacterium]